MDIARIGCIQTWQTTTVMGLYSTAIYLKGLCTCANPSVCGVPLSNTYAAPIDADMNFLMSPQPQHFHDQHSSIP